MLRTRQAEALNEELTASEARRTRLETQTQSNYEQLELEKKALEQKQRELETLRSSSQKPAQEQMKSTLAAYVSAQLEHSEAHVLEVMRALERKLSHLELRVRTVC